ncbi:hypothetical protein [Ammoniphilus sp. YIM 78166]|uniref:hypothetical protein n=1 Tax=Ammoniphilus sp. YIM 78166 TaxID=1644106 RepID=UPI00107055F3|nr:hypothetical protein [Ammoniphilus sp. YIM 78166]
MKWGAIVGATFIVSLMTLYEWPKLNRKQKKEKAAFVALTGMGWLLAILLAHFPELPSPTKVVEAVYKPLGKLLE